MTIVPLRKVLAVFLIVALVATMLVPLTPSCEEDEACWDCHTMGNRLCGPVARLESAL